MSLAKDGAIYPVRSSPWWRSEGTVVVAVPRKRSLLSRALCALLGGPDHVNVRLDDLGTRVHELADGARSMSMIVATLRRELGSDASRLEERLAVHLARLSKLGAIRFAAKPASGTGPTTPATVSCRRCANRWLTIDPGARARCPGCGRISRMNRS